MSGKKAPAGKTPTQSNLITTFFKKTPSPAAPAAPAAAAAAVGQGAATSPGSAASDTSPAGPTQVHKSPAQSSAPAPSASVGAPSSGPVTPIDKASSAPQKPPSSSSSSSSTSSGASSAAAVTPAPKSTHVADDSNSDDDAPVAVQRSRLKKLSEAAPAPSSSSSSAGKGASGKPPAKKPRAAAPSDDDDDGSDEDASAGSNDDDDSDSGMDDLASEDEDEGPKGKGKGKGGGGKGASSSSAGAKRKRPAPAAAGKGASASSSSSSASKGPGGGKSASSPVGGGGGDSEDEGAGAGAGAGGGGPRVLSRGQHKHNAFPFLRPDKLMDAQRRRPDHPQYDPRTLHVPPEFVASQTPAQQQWWAFKAAHFDTVLLFKMGKFYETFHMDADTLVVDAGCVYMSGDVAHAGFPEAAYAYNNEALVRRGHRVARVEQTETPQQLEERNAAAPRGKKDKVVRRELCSIRSAGTRTYGILDIGSVGPGKGAGSAAAASEDACGGDGVYATAGPSDDGAFGYGTMPTAQYLYTLCEVPVAPAAAAAASAGSDSSSSSSSSSISDASSSSSGFVRLGVVVSDIGSGDVRLAEFVDDRSRSRLRTMFARLPPVEVLWERPSAAGSGASSSSSSSSRSRSRPSGVSEATRRSFPACVVSRQALAQGTEFLCAADAFDEVWMVPYTKPALVAGAGFACGAPNAAGKQLGLALRDVVLRDYFAVDAEDFPSTAAASSSSASGGAPSPSAVAARYRTCAVERCPDGKLRAFPQALFDAMQRARSDGFATPGTFTCPGGGLLEGCDVPPSTLALSAFGALVWYLRRSLADYQVFSMRRFSAYRHGDGQDGSLVLAGLSLDGSGALAAASSSSYASKGASAAGDEPMGSGAAPPHSTSSSSSHEDAYGHVGPRGEGDGYIPHMVLDGSALANLEILENTDTGGRAGTLIKVLDTTVTTFGRRRFRQWLCAPLLRPEDIEDRLRAVEDLMPLVGAATSTGSKSSSASASILTKALNMMRQLPDLERLSARVHTLGSRVSSRDHPDARAVMYENETYGKRKINDLLQALKAFETADKVRDLFHDPETGDLRPEVSSSPLLARTLHDRFPSLRQRLAFFQRAFDANEAKSTGSITPAPGVDPRYDGAVADIKQIKGELSSYLETQRRELKCSGVEYFDSKKDRYQLELPESLSSRLPAGWMLQGKAKRKGIMHCRYTTPETVELLERLEDAEGRRDDASRDALRHLFGTFDSHRASWDAAITCLATLDCLAALATWSARGDGGVMCRPEVVAAGHSPSESSTAVPAASELAPFLHLTAVRHPCMGGLMKASDLYGAGASSSSSSSSESTYIPNDILLGWEHTEEEADGMAHGAGAGAGPAQLESRVGGPPCVLITGANAGGKSSTLRTTALCAILAQLGCYVPGERCRMTPVDRVFTRMGASDRMLAGQSTFVVELAETSSILASATRGSLVLLDELGRGTSTFDGCAIAYAVTKHLTSVTRCRTMFATHYHGLCEDFQGDPAVALGHMACLVGDGPDGHKVVTFLYKFSPGECPKSYGLNVARLARLPPSVIDRAKAKSEEFEAAVLEAEVAALLTTASRPPGGGGSPAHAGSSGAMDVDDGDDDGSGSGRHGVLALDDDAKLVALFRQARRLFGAGPTGAGAEDDDARVALPPGQLERTAVKLLEAATLVSGEGSGE